MHRIIQLFLLLCLTFSGNAFSQTVANFTGFTANSNSQNVTPVRSPAAPITPIPDSSTASQDIICTLEMARNNPDSCFSKTTVKPQKKSPIIAKENVINPTVADLKVVEKIDVQEEKKKEDEAFTVEKFDLKKVESAPIVIKDPIEKVNRKVYAFNEKVDKHVLEPVAKAYEVAVPKPARQSVNNFLSNASAPMSFFNSLLQGDFDNAMATFSHLLINTTVGIGGLFDVAGKKGIKYNKETFSKTLESYGVGTGPYYPEDIKLNQLPSRPHASSISNLLMMEEIFDRALIRLHSFHDGGY